MRNNCLKCGIEINEDNEVSVLVAFAGEYEDQVMQIGGGLCRQCYLEEDE